MANNPALLLLLIATLEGFPFRWPTGEHSLLLVSVGTGHWERRDDPERVVRARAWDWATEIPSMLIQDASAQNELLLQYLSRTATRRHIDREAGDLRNDLLGPNPLLSYVRYDLRLDEDVITSLDPDSLSGLRPARRAARVRSLRSLSAARNRDWLLRLGRRAAMAQVTPEHFPETFDLPREG
jgi:hypothetical protein